MRPIFLIAFFILIAANAPAQKIRFSDSTNVWSQFASYYNDGMPPNNYLSSHFFIKDTLVQSVEYRKFDFGCVREDTVLNKVFIRDFFGDSDITLLDYNLQVGDTFVTTYDTQWHHYYKFPVTSVDSTMINGVWHKVWHFSTYFSPHSTNWPSDIIEGIGCIQHPTYMLSDGGVEPPDLRVYCFSNNGARPTISPQVSFFNNAGSCTYYPHLSTAAPVAGVDISCYPNPASRMLKIDGDAQRISSVTITDLYGKVIYTAHVPATGIFLDVESWPAGMYLLRANNGAVRRFLKTDN